MKKSNHSSEIPTEILHEIFLRLPAKDLGRSSCVSKLWRGIIGDPSFVKLHDAAPSSESEALLVSEHREPGRRDEASVFNLPPRKAMCRVAIPTGYVLANVCNGFLCFAINHGEAPPVVCNPLTGETLELPKAPPLTVAGYGSSSIALSHLFALGFSPTTMEYKMFRLSFPSSSYSTHDKIHIAVHTLGGGGGSGGGGWRQDSYSSRSFPVYSSPPVNIDGKLYVLTYDYDRRRRDAAARVLVLDVATETYRSYRIPYYYGDYNQKWKEMLATGFDLNGQMCLAVNILGPEDHRKLQFWVMTPPPAGELEDMQQVDDDKLYWELRYSFDLHGENYYFKQLRSAWTEDHGQMLCYRHSNSLYKHDIRGHSSSSYVGSLSFDQKAVEIRTPFVFPDDSSELVRLSCWRWNIWGGYRPSLLSPLIFASPQSQDEEGRNRQSEHTLLSALAEFYTPSR